MHIVYFKEKWESIEDVIINKSLLKIIFSFNQCIQLDSKYTGEWIGQGNVLNNLRRNDEALEA